MQAHQTCIGVSLKALFGPFPAQLKMLAMVEDSIRLIIIEVSLTCTRSLSRSEQATSNMSSKKLVSLCFQTNKEDDSNKYDDILHAIESMESRISNIRILEETVADKVTAAVREKMEIIRQEFKEDLVELCSRVTKLEASVKDHPLLDPQLRSEVCDFNACLKVLLDAVTA